MEYFYKLFAAYVPFYPCQADMKRYLISSIYYQVGTIKRDAAETCPTICRFYDSHHSKVLELASLQLHIKLQDIKWNTKCLTFNHIFSPCYQYCFDKGILRKCRAFKI